MNNLENNPVTQIRSAERGQMDIYINKIIGDEPHLSRVRDISVSGIYLYKLLEPSLRDGTQVGLEIMLPGTNDVIWAVGEVVREDERAVGDGVALRFVRIAQHDRELIAQYVESERHADEMQSRAA